MLSSKMTCLFAPDIFSIWNFSFYVISRWFCKRKLLVLLFKRQKQQHTHPVHFITLQGPAAYRWMWEVGKPQTDVAAEFGRSNWTQSCVIPLVFLMLFQLEYMRSYRSCRRFCVNMSQHAAAQQQATLALLPAGEMYASWTSHRPALVSCGSSSTQLDKLSLAHMQMLNK